MKILVPIKRVIDYNVNIQVKSDQSGVQTENVKMSMNPFDEIALEQALRFKEAGDASEVIVLSIGSDAVQETLRTGLAMGADAAVHIQTDAELIPLDVAKICQQLVSKYQIALVMMGKQAIDDDANQTGQMLAGLLNWPQGTFASNIELKSDGIYVTREVDGGLETLKLSKPAVLTADLRLNTPRYVKLPNIMKAKKKSIECIALDSLAISLCNTVHLVKVTEPASRSSGVKVNSVAELIDKLKNEAKVIV